MTDFNKNKVQNIRRSQFILTFGPGSIIESVNGPRLIPSLHTGLGKNFYYYANKYEVPNIRMSYVIKNRDGNNSDEEVKFFTLPSNSSEGKLDNIGIYKTSIFPVWKICYGNHKNGSAILFDSSKHSECPECGQKSKNHVRFICACPDGHLDEVPWFKSVHGNDSCNHFKDYFYWDGGNSLKDIVITCPVCKDKTNMGEIYSSQYHHCTGRFPEKENNEDFQNVSYSTPYYRKCSNVMRVIQRQSTSLRVSNNLTLIKIPKYERDVIKALQWEDVKFLTIDAIEDNYSKEKYLKKLARTKRSKAKKDIMSFIDQKSYDEFLEEATELYNGNYDMKNVLLQEFDSLNSGYQSEDDFEIAPSKEFTIKIQNKDFTFDVSSVNKIKTVTAQFGYQRKPYLKKEDNAFVDPNIVDNGEKDRENECIWYPVFEGTGEGIYITSDFNPIIELGLEDNANEWLDNEPTFNSRGRDEVKNPLFVWWHSLSHALIRTLSFKSGYSAASIRERVYVDLNTDKGGILLFTTTTGDDCSMGGLIEATDNFDEILNDAFDSIKLCSYDPLCNSTRISPEKVNGAACIYCLLLPETSCEHNNMWLDRHLLLGN